MTGLPEGTARMDVVDRLAVKLLAQAAQQLGRMTAEALCNEPQKPLIGSMLGELRAMLDEFEDAYLADSDGGSTIPKRK